METDLFGDVPAPVTNSKCGPKGGKHYTKQAGYAGLPGTGPAGETCGSCVNMSGRGGRFRKCRLMQLRWTGGPKTDVLARSPACAEWQSLNGPGE